MKKMLKKFASQFLGFGMIITEYIMQQNSSNSFGISWELVEPQFCGQRGRAAVALDCPKPT
jgi:hypothetical protein